MAGRRDIDRTYKCVSEWRFFLVKSCICSFILSCFWQPYECVTGLSKVFWVVVSRYVCYSVCFSIFGKNSKVKFLIFFSWVVSFVLGSLWVVLRSSPVVWRSLWIVVGRCGSLWVVPGFSNYAIIPPPNLSLPTFVNFCTSNQKHVIDYRIKESLNFPSLTTRSLFHAPILFRAL